MGLDISFNKEQAVKAGMSLSTERVGTDAQIASAEGNGDIAYLGYLLGEETLAHISEYVNFFTVSEGTDQDDTIILFARANKWGNLYKPLTNFLTKHGIEWDES